MYNQRKGVCSKTNRQPNNPCELLKWHLSYQRQQTYLAAKYNDEEEYYCNENTRAS